MLTMMIILSFLICRMNIQRYHSQRVSPFLKGQNLNNLGLLINYDDAFVLYVNGRRLMNSNNLIINEESGEITVNNHEANGAEYFSLNNFAGAFKFGKNVIAFEGHNTNLESSDFTLDPQVHHGRFRQLYTETNRKVDYTTFRTTHFYKDRTWNGTIDELNHLGKALMMNKQNYGIKEMVSKNYPKRHQNR